MASQFGIGVRGYEVARRLRLQPQEPKTQWMTTIKVLNYHGSRPKVKYNATFTSVLLHPILNHNIQSLIFLSIQSTFPQHKQSIPNFSPPICPTTASGTLIRAHMAKQYAHGTPMFSFSHLLKSSISSTRPPFVLTYLLVIVRG